jgi:hypothetical protein
MHAMSQRHRGPAVSVVPDRAGHRRRRRALRRCRTPLRRGRDGLGQSRAAVVGHQRSGRSHAREAAVDRRLGRSQVQTDLGQQLVDAYRGAGMTCCCARRVAAPRGRSDVDARALRPFPRLSSDPTPASASIVAASVTIAAAVEHWADRRYARLGLRAVDFDPELPKRLRPRSRARPPARRPPWWLGTTCARAGSSRAPGTSLPVRFLTRPAPWRPWRRAGKSQRGRLSIGVCQSRLRALRGVAARFGERLSEAPGGRPQS